MDREDPEVLVKELDAWHDLIGRQKEQLPGLSDLLKQAIRDRREADEGMLSNAEMLQKAIREQEQCMLQIREELLQQMHFLSERSNGRKNGFQLRATTLQTRLREDVRKVEKTYFELKSSLMNYIWSVSWKP